MIYDSASHTLSSSLMKAIVDFSKYMLSYYLCVYLLSGFYPQFTRSSLAMSKLSNYVIYNLSFLILLSILINVLNGEFSPLYFLELYMPYMAYRGVTFLCVDSNKSMKFVIISSIICSIISIRTKVLYAPQVESILFTIPSAYTWLAHSRRSINVPPP